ncbi:ATP-binding protein [Demequina sp. SYSU T00068]|uniref:sensor histidine kinase n=1 Tax=Demequina lignilytica TaxID=3051663 RepID=UPI002614E0AC|nr:ATP-binding protein [Demequina sp. SYSU T00068]MDN4491053.1 ATP-binding protein [Demequina sp. SYSU T00068]
MTTGSTPVHRSALERLQRTVYFATGLATALFAALLSSGPNGFVAQLDQLVVPFGAFTVLVGNAVPASLAILAWVLPIRALRILVTGSAAGFVASQLMWVPMMTADTLADGAAPWLQGFGAIYATLLAVAWGKPIVWVFPIVQGPMVATVEYLSAGGNLEQSLLDGMGALVTNLILMGAGAGAVNAAARQDQEAEHARAVAAHEAALRTAEREQARINALVHDDIMSVLLAAVRTPDSPAVAEQAQQALASVATIRETRTRASAYAPGEVVAVLRTTANEAGEDIVVTSDVTTLDHVPAQVVAALAEATREALRNSMIHAGGPEVRRELAVTITEGEVHVTVRDDGRGFNPRTVPPRRLGLAVSIHGRMNALSGGGARVVSSPGAGANVELWWRAEDVQ